MKLLQGFEQPVADESFFRAYSEPFATPAECEGVIAFPKSIVTGSFRPEQSSPEAVAQVRSKPAIMIEGMRVRMMFQGMEDLFAGSLRCAQESGEISKLHDVRSLARLIVTAIEGLRIYGKVQPSDRSLADVVDSIVGICR
jgi:hypothetical protein